MAPRSSNRLDPTTRAAQYLYHCISKNKYFFTFEARGYPDEEEFGHLGLFQPYFAELNPDCPLGRAKDHCEDPATLLPIPKLLQANCLDRDQYPWSILCFGSDGWEWDWQREKLYKEFNVDAYKAKRAPLTYPTVTQSAMSTITPLAQQSSYP